MKKFTKNLFWSDTGWLVLLLVFIIPASLPLLHRGFYYFSDEPHIANLYQMIRAIGSGQIPPRWAPDMSYNYGYPLFNFYYPLPFYIGALFYELTGSLVISLKMLFLLTIPASSMLMYKWLRLHADKLTSFTGALVYTFTPYRAVDLYIRGALGELYAFIFFPLIAYFVYKVAKSGETKDIGFLSLFTALLILSHNLAPLIFMPGVFIYGFIISLTTFKNRNYIKIFEGIIVGFLISAFFWMPSLIEQKYLVSITPFNYKDHFPFIKQLIIPSWGYGASNPGVYDDMSFQIGLVNISLIIVTAIFVYKKGLKNIEATIFLAATLLILFMMNIRSTFIWEISTLSKFIQFPWRLLMLTAFLTSSMVIFINSRTKIGKILLIVLIMFSLLAGLAYFKPSEYYNPDDNYFLKRFFANRLSAGKSQESLIYKNYSEDYLLLPVWARDRPSELQSAKFTSDDLVIIGITEHTSIDYTAEVNGKGDLYFNSYYFPGWYAEVNGNEVPTEIKEPNGNIKIHLDGTPATVRVYWKETPFRLFTDFLSLAGFALAGLLILKKKHE
ncbi:hypothetical protein A3A76_03805 [Candidatus Woesebacteria bacterium RIFCSPLOWO2_01_FULL_39_23]|uniref:Membrane protein 6-pyruvoyl-tetrahydropterin synthase-related domain-containing protein n=1 Tax=Candidatus Woesebacteria bacterium RIFCSPHIGHO2_01_FULL_40_22 TaxID=1802499 RepID=A0A1F7YLV2_9BACT|nr:MAG: hypothetical protein A2141_00215 [Candidatus Woesebacteria bacterium RBG_16_40_11]OGM27578.1 MAG: hypothetical protein A2628_02205 [Candidatus Woesebacteria bacterium RIFCSPHIGHO2_01_FULL_40_22]OGM62752.1 MAG: hypothetical protein A3A76_03805 [Candidatus Woesebacteria bacterium RIFCSPLOWO2_01_FULL_39_23]